jgi:hypothetical protein
MATFRIIAAVFGFCLIVAVLWNLRGPRFRGSDEIERDSDARLYDDWPAD